jgi:hypothetical protein
MFIIKEMFGELRRTDLDRFGLPVGLSGDSMLGPCSRGFDAP